MTNSLEGGSRVLPTKQIRHPVRTLRTVVLVAAVSVLLVELGARVEIVMKAAGIPKNATGIGGFVNGAHALRRSSRAPPRRGCSGSRAPVRSSATCSAGSGR
jgi:hypothetical protein